MVGLLGTSCDINGIANTNDALTPKSESIGAMEGIIVEREGAATNDALTPESGSATNGALTPESGSLDAMEGNNRGKEGDGTCTSSP